MKHILLSLLFSGIIVTLHSQSQEPVLPPLKVLPGAPENAPAVLKTGKDSKEIALIYHGGIIFEGHFPARARITTTSEGEEAITQRIHIRFDRPVTWQAVVHGSGEALAAETRGAAQERFPLVRTTHGLSNSLRNNAVYDRRYDWMLEAPEGTVIRSSRNSAGTTHFELTLTGKEIDLVFRPRYYQKHKNLPYYEPWTYKIYKESVTGWSSWWAYFRGFNEKDLHDLLRVWQEKHFDDYGYRFIQIDDVYQGGNDQGRTFNKLAYGYQGGRPSTWLDWKKDLFPTGMTGYVHSVDRAGFVPAVWIGSFFSDEAIVQKHPGWFVTGPSGKPFAAPWVSYALDATNPEVADALIRPTYKGLKDAGFQYVKIDQLRHYLYDNLHHNLGWCQKKKVRPDEVLRAYLKIAREEMGEDAFILSCWGVLPESIGLADACRIGGDGYGPVTLQQYNSWNGIVWRNDPDHCDVLPVKKAGETGNVKKTVATRAIPKESILRPALASIAGAMLILSDKPEIYTQEENLYGLRRSSPVLFSVPGQLYDYDPGKTDWLREHARTEITSGKSPTPIDGDQFGAVCPYWLNEFNTFFDQWVVLHRLNWSDKKSLPAATIRFADLGLDPAKEYLVYEFWSDTLLGVFDKAFPLGTLEPYGLESLAIREKIDRPQLVSTNRHLSQGAVDIEKLLWKDNTLKGRSRVIVDDPYVITLYVPDNYRLHSVNVDGTEAGTIKHGHTLKIFWKPEQTESVRWEVSFTKNTP